MDPGVPVPPRWTDDASLDAIQATVRRCTPWKNGLTSPQLRLVSLILEGVSIIYINATGSGKSCAFSIPILILNEYNKTPEVFPSGLRRFAKPVGLVITPTKGLANNLVRIIPFSCTEYDTHLIHSGQRAVPPRYTCTCLHIGDSCGVSAQEGQPLSTHSTLRGLAGILCRS
jgi:hypothetical protein